MMAQAGGDNDRSTDKQKRIPFWMKAAFTGSVALNLVFVSFVAGAVLRGGPSGRVSQDFAIPFTRALEKEERRKVGKQIRDSLREKNGGRNGRELRQAAFAKTLAAIRAEPFDRAVFIATMESQSNRAAEFSAAGRAALAEHLAEMSAEARADYADRVEAIGLRHRKKGPPKDR